MDLTTAEEKIEDLQIDLITAEENIDDLQEQIQTTEPTPEIQKSSAYCGIQSDIGHPDGTKISNGIITYEEITSNVEADETNFSLNLETGIFTVNKDGVYSFSASAVSAHTDNNAYLKINLITSEINQDEKESPLMGLFSDGTDKLKRSLFGTRLVDLKEGDEFSLEYDCEEGGCGIDKLYSCVMMIETKGTCGFQDLIENGDGTIEVDNEGETEKVIIYDQTNPGLLSTSTGRFTADQTGVYSVSVSAFVGRLTAGGNLYVYLGTTSEKYLAFFQRNIINLDHTATEVNLHASISATKMLTLNEGEQLWLEYKCNVGECAIEGLHFCIFYVGQKEEVSPKAVAVNGNEMENPEEEVSTTGVTVNGNEMENTITEGAYCGYTELWGEEYGVILYDQVFDELGPDSLLNKDTGKFTAGVAGTYQVTVSIQIGTTFEDSELQIYLKTDSMMNQGDDEGLLLNQQKIKIGEDRQFLYTPLSASRLVTLELNEKLWLEYKCLSATELAFCNMEYITTCIYLVPQLAE